MLWAPTFRGNAKKKKGEEALLPGEAYVNLLMENEEYYVIKSLHPHLHKEERMSTSEALKLKEQADKQRERLMSASNKAAHFYENQKKGE